MDNKIRLFEDKKYVRHGTRKREKGKWYFSVVDVCGVLSGADIHDVIGATLNAN